MHLNCANDCLIDWSLEENNNNNNIVESTERARAQALLFIIVIVAQTRIAVRPEAAQDVPLLAGIKTYRVQTKLHLQQGKVPQ